MEAKITGWLSQKEEKQSFWPENKSAGLLSIKKEPGHTGEKGRKQEPICFPDFICVDSPPLSHPETYFSQSLVLSPLCSSCLI